MQSENAVIGAERPRAFGIQIFTRVDGRAIAHNIFLDGNTFENSHSVDREVFVADLSTGAVANYRNTSLTFADAARPASPHRRGPTAAACSV